MRTSLTFRRVVLVWLAGLLAGGCTAVDPLKNAPATAERPWDATGASRALAGDADRIAKEASPPAPDPTHAYTLAELVDFAQRSNRSTRAAWEQARAAAVGVGLSQAEFYPVLILLASYGGGLWDLDINFNNNLSGLGQRGDLIGALLGPAVPANVDLDLAASGAYRALNTGAALRWMLFDFGAREAKMDAARRSQLAANLAFNATHQAVILKVVQTYYACQAAKRQLAAAASATGAARRIAEAATAQAGQGLLTEPLLLLARQASAQADYAEQTARAAVDTAWIDLSEAVGFPPGTNLRIADANFDKLEQEMQKPLDAHVRAAMATRPDLLAKVAVVQAKEAELRAARADLLPKLSLDGFAAYNRFDTSVNNTGPLDQMGFGLQNYGGFLTVQWPIFTGFAEQNKVRLAATQRGAAAEELALAREKTIAEVWRGYTRAKNALARRESAAGLVKATRNSYDASLAGFDRGVTPIQDVLSAQAAWAQATALEAASDSEIAVSLAALAFASGTLK